MTRKERRIIIKSINARFDGIYSVAKKVCADYDTKIAPLNLLRELITIAKMGTVDDTDFGKTLVKNHNSMCSALMNVLEKEARRMHSSGVSLNFVEAVIGTVKKNFKEGIEGR